MNVKFYNFQKRTNSTKIPGSGESYINYPCQLKAETSIVNPTLILETITAGNTPTYTYVYIESFSRYYFIVNWRWTNGVWECDCVPDVLASFKTAIGNMSEYVVRSASESNGQIADMQYPTTAETRVNATDLSITPGNLPVFQSVLAGGYYVLGVISNDSNSAQGAVTYYQMTPAQLAALKNYMMSDTFLTDQGLTVQTVTDVLPTEILKTLYNPYQYIASCVWMPFPESDFISSLKTLSSIGFGWFEPTDTGTTIQGYRLNANGYVKTYTERISVYGHPQRPDRGVFLDHSPYSDRMIFYPPFGSIPINDDSIIGGDFIRIELTVDMIFGDAVLTLFHDRPLGNDSYDNMGVIARVSAPLAVPIQLAQTSVDINGSVTAAETLAIQGSVKAFIGAASSGKGFLSTLYETGKAAVSESFSAIGDLIQNPVGQLQTSGTNGSLAQYSTHPYFVQKWRIIADDDNTQKGRPLCRVKTLNTLSGFMMIDSPDVSISCMEPERQAIADFMTNGFFYE